MTEDSYDRNEPLSFTLGKGEVISCWDRGFLGLAEGAKAELICPPKEAYGSIENGPIPADSTIYFTIEVVSIQ